MNVESELNVQHDSLQALEETAEYILTGGDLGRPANLSSTQFLSTMNQQITYVTDFTVDASPLTGLVPDVAIILKNLPKDPNVVMAICQEPDVALVDTTNDSTCSAYFNALFAPGSIPKLVFQGTLNANDVGYFPRDLDLGSGYTNSYPGFTNTFDRGVASTAKIELTVPFQQAGNTNLLGQQTLACVSTAPTSSELTKAGLAGFTKRTAGTLARTTMPNSSCGVLIGGTEPDYLNGKQVVKSPNYGWYRATKLINSANGFSDLTSLNTSGSRSGIQMFNLLNVPPRYDDNLELSWSCSATLQPDVLAVAQDVFRYQLYVDWGYVNSSNQLVIETIFADEVALTLSRITTGSAPTGTVSSTIQVANPQSTPVGGHYFPRFLIGARIALNSSSLWAPVDTHNLELNVKLYDFNIAYTQPQAIILITDDYEGPVTITRQQSWQVIPNSSQAPLLAGQLSNPSDPMARGVIMNICNRVVGSTQGFVGTLPEYNHFKSALSSYDWAAFKMAQARRAGQSPMALVSAPRSVQTDQALAAAGVYGVGQQMAAGVYGAAGLKARLKKRRADMVYSLADAGMDTVEGIAHTPEAAMSIYGASGNNYSVSNYLPEDIKAAPVISRRTLKDFKASGVGNVPCDVIRAASISLNNYSRSGDPAHLTPSAVSAYQLALRQRDMATGNYGASGSSAEYNIETFYDSDGEIKPSAIEDSEDPEDPDPEEEEEDGDDDVEEPPPPSVRLRGSTPLKGKKTIAKQKEEEVKIDMSKAGSALDERDKEEALNQYVSMLGVSDQIPISINDAVTGIDFVDPSCMYKPNASIIAFQSGGARGKGFDTFNVANGLCVQGNKAHHTVAIVSMTQLNFPEFAGVNYIPIRGIEFTDTVGDQVVKKRSVLHVADCIDLENKPENQETIQGYMSLISVLTSMKKSGSFYVNYFSRSAKFTSGSIKGPSLVLATFAAILGLPQGPVITGNLHSDGRIAPVGEMDVKILSVSQSRQSWVNGGGMDMLIIPSDDSKLQDVLSSPTTDKKKKEATRLVIDIINRGSTSAMFDVLTGAMGNSWIKAVDNVSEFLFQFLGNYFYRQSISMAPVAKEVHWFQSRFKAMLRFQQMPAAAKTTALSLYGVSSDGARNLLIDYLTWSEATAIIERAKDQDPAVINALTVLRMVFAEPEEQYDTTDKQQELGRAKKANKAIINDYVQGKIQLTLKRADAQGNKVVNYFMPAYYGKKVNPLIFKGREQTFVIGHRKTENGPVDVTTTYYVLEKGTPYTGRLPASKKNKDIDFSALPVKEKPTAKRSRDSDASQEQPRKKLGQR